MITQNCSHGVPENTCRICSQRAGSAALNADASRAIKTGDEVRCDRAILLEDRVRVRMDLGWVDLVPTKKAAERHEPRFGDGREELLDKETIVQAASDMLAGRDPLQRADEPALRYDGDKVRYDLLPADALEALAQVYTVGAKKYAERNWEKGMSFSRCFASLMRHSWKFWRGEETDSETGCHHMAMAAWNCFALYCYAMRGVGKDDRPGELHAK